MKVVVVVEKFSKVLVFFMNGKMELKIIDREVVLNLFVLNSLIIDG